MTGLVVFFFILGATIGSFLNVVIYRLPRDESIVKPGSRCTACGNPVSFYDNIPIVSYVLLRGRCRKCSRKFSPRYALVEAITGLLFSVCYVRFDLTLDLAILLVFLSLLITVSFIDLDFYIIPDILSLGGIVLGITTSFFRHSFTYTDSIIGVLIGGGLLYAIAKSYELARKREGMGGGDIKLLGMIGAFCGWHGVVFSLVIGSFAGTAVGIPLMIIKRHDTKYALPFGPFLSLGALTYVIVGESVIAWFFGALG